MTSVIAMISSILFMIYYQSLENNSTGLERNPKRLFRNLWKIFLKNPSVLHAHAIVVAICNLKLRYHVKHPQVDIILITTIRILKSHIHFKCPSF